MRQVDEDMRRYFEVFVAAALGAAAGLLLAGRILPSQGPEARKLIARELVLVDGVGRVAARLSTDKGETWLRFYSENGAKAAELGLDSQGTGRGLRFFGRDGEALVALNSLGENMGASTLYLGDDRMGARVMIGALPEDVISEAPIDEWGLVMRKPGSLQSPFSILLHPYKSEGWIASIRLVRPDGTEWGKW
jgi:hypothetical protein